MKPWQEKMVPYAAAAVPVAAIAGFIWYGSGNSYDPNAGCDHACQVTRQVERGEFLLRAAEQAQVSQECRIQAEMQRIRLMHSGMHQNEIISPDCSTWH